MMLLTGFGPVPSMSPWCSTTELQQTIQLLVAQCKWVLRSPRRLFAPNASDSIAERGKAVQV
jgi:hypothetical protein